MLFSFDRIRSRCKHRLLPWTRLCPFPPRRVLRLVVLAYLSFLLLTIIFELFSLSSSKHDRPSETDVDVVYTWVNGSDPQFANSLRETTNQLLYEQLASLTCSLAQSSLLLPLALIRPALPLTSRHVAGVIEYTSFNSSATLLRFVSPSAGNLDFVRKYKFRIRSSFEFQFAYRSVVNLKVD